MAHWCGVNRCLRVGKNVLEGWVGGRVGRVAQCKVLDQVWVGGQRRSISSDVLLQAPHFALHGGRAQAIGAFTGGCSGKVDVAQQQHSVHFRVLYTRIVWRMVGGIRVLAGSHNGMGLCEPYISDGGGQASLPNGEKVGCLHIVKRLQQQRLQGKVIRRD